MGNPLSEVLRRGNAECCRVTKFRNHKDTETQRQSGSVVHIVKANVVPLILGTPGWVRKSGKNSAVLAVLGMVGLQSKADSGTACQIWKVYFGSHNGAVWVFQMPFFAYGQQYLGSRRSDRCRPETYLIDGKVICGRPIFS